MGSLYSLRELLSGISLFMPHAGPASGTYTMRRPGWNMGHEADLPHVLLV